MRNIIFFKKIDLAVQLLLVVTALVLTLNEKGEAFLYGYFILGGWQLLSAFIHGCGGPAFYRVPLRRSYEKALLWILIIGVVTLPVFIAYLLVMLGVGPVMAIIYMVVCFDEIALLRKREMVHIR